MTENQNLQNNKQPNKLILILGIVVLFLLISVAGLAGFLLGKSTVIDEPAPLSTPETLTEYQEVTIEVTREVNIVVTSTKEAEPPTIELVQPLDRPDIVETKVPLPEGEENFSFEETDFDTYNEVWSLVEEGFDGELPEERKRMYAAISGSLETLNDDYTRFIRPDVAQRIREDMNGSVSGIGAFVKENEEGYVEITRPIDGQPADLAGLLPGDSIIGIDGEDVEGLDFNEVLLLVRGPEGTTVKLTIFRQGEEEPLEFSIIRTLFEVPVVESELLGTEENPIAYVKLTNFTHTAETAVLDALNPLLEQEPKGIIFDLRDNGGGFLDQAVGVADIFLNEGVVLFERSSDGIDKTFDSDAGDIGETLPLVVLINAGSASASEIVAGAVQDRDRGILIGEPTFGKGSVQMVHHLTDGSELRVTIARWYTPDERSISEEGVTPDIEAESPMDLGGEDDTQLQRAIEFLLEGE